MSAWHEQHEIAASAVEPVRDLPEHALLEAYSVLTRLPSGLAVSPADAARVLARRFDRSPLRLGARERDAIVQTLAAAGVYGGAAYDGLVGLEARAHDRTLLTLDQRATATYQRLGVPFRLLAA